MADHVRFLPTLKGWVSSHNSYDREVVGGDLKSKVVAYLVDVL